jgi:ABC-type multidrug transport system ATPase subunit
MEKSIRLVAQELKDLITQGTLFKAPALSDFAKEYAYDTAIIDAGLGLEIDFLEETNVEAKQKLRERMLIFIDRVVEDYIENTESVLIARTKDAQQRKQLIENRNAKERGAVVFECRHLGKKFGKTGFHLTDIDLQLRVGEITGVVGENGNGKTTLFRICVGDLEHNEGEIRYPDLHQTQWNKIQWYDAKKHIAFIPQELAKWHGSLINNLRLEANLHGFKGEQNEEQVQYILQRMELTPYIDKQWSELSGGYKLRFALAKALVGKPRLLVIDEPLANLDVNAQMIILNDLKDLVESRIFPVAIMISSQHLHEIERIADNLLFLKSGKELYNGKTQEFGAERMENCFEIECNLTQQVFEEKIKGFAYHSVKHNGQYLIMYTPLHIKEKEVLSFLLEQDIKITYFRNISQSIKKYFV